MRRVESKSISHNNRQLYRVYSRIERKYFTIYRTLTFINTVMIIKLNTFDYIAIFISTHHTIYTIFLHMRSWSRFMRIESWPCGIIVSVYILIAILAIDDLCYNIDDVFLMLPRPY
jgi:hypothetical protein